MCRVPRAASPSFASFPLTYVAGGLDGDSPMPPFPSNIIKFNKSGLNRPSRARCLSPGAVGVWPRVCDG